MVAVPAEGYKAALVPGALGVQLVTSEDGDVLGVHMSQAQLREPRSRRFLMLFEAL